MTRRVLKHLWSSFVREVVPSIMVGIILTFVLAGVWFVGSWVVHFFPQSPGWLTVFVLSLIAVTIIACIIGGMRNAVRDCKTKKESLPMYSTDIPAAWEVTEQYDSGEEAL